jgi:hypothetical protein
VAALGAGDAGRGAEAAVVDVERQARVGEQRLAVDADVVREIRRGAHGDFDATAG